jgi:hypothetical protein
MSYSPVKRPVEGLGYTLVIGTPVGDQRITIPIEQLANDVANMAINAAWPLAQQKLYAEIPTIAKAAMDAAKPYFRQEIDRAAGIIDTKTGQIEGKVGDVVKQTTRTAYILVGVLVAAGVGVTAFTIISKKKHAKVAA